MKRKKQVVFDREIAASLVPTNWCDPLLTGPKAVIGNQPYNCSDIERLLRAVKQRIQGDVAGREEGR